FYTLFAPAGMRTITATMTGYAPGIVTATVVDATVTVRDIALDAGLLAVAPESVTLTLTAGLTATRAITLSNGGGYTVDFAVDEINAPFTPVTVTGPFAGTARRVSPKHLHDLNAATVREYDPPDVPLLDAGAVVQTWDSGLTSPWGVVYDTDTGVLWLSDTRLGGGEDRNVAFQPDGVPTGASLPTSPWVALFAADIAYNPLTGKLWQVNVGEDNCIYELDAATQTATGRALCPPVGVSQRGLAYDPTTDTFYSGSWSDQILYHFDATGQLLDSVDLKLNIAGLAYNPATAHLFVMSNAEIGRDVYVLDVADGYTLIGGFDIAGLGSLEQAGLALDCDGTLWTVNQATGQVIQAVSGETSICAWEEIPWLTTNPVSGTLVSGGEQVVALNVDASGMAAGTYPVHLRVANSTPYGELNVPITLTVVQTHDVLLAPSATAQGGLPGALVTYTFTTTNTGMETDTFTVTLSGADWPATAAPTVGPLAAGESAPLTVTVTVPAAALCDALDTLTVTVTSQGNPARTSSATATTSARAVYAVQARVAAMALSADPGASVSTSLWVTNTGNCVDTFSLSAASAWSVGVSATTGALAAGAGIATPLTVTVPSNALAGDFDVAMLTATSQANYAITTTTAVTTTANVVYSVTLSPVAMAASGRIGQAVVYTLTLTNAGNVSDTYALGVDGAMWDTTLAPPLVTLDAAAVVPVVVTVTVPAGASSGALDTAQITATGTGVAASSDLTTTATVSYGVALDAAVTSGEAVAGQTVAYTVRVTNTGDYSDTFVLVTSGNVWTTTVVTEAGPLAAGHAVEIDVLVEIPPDAAIGAIDTVTLTATSQADAATADSLMLTTTVTECVSVDGAGFGYTPPQPFVGEAVTFTGTVTAGTLPIVYTWDFGDGGTATGAIVTHTFPAETAILPYTVVMTATNACGWDAAEQIITVHSYQIYLPLVMRASD
ncbi:MAG: PKD domain-containing protein, partial [Anaerolineae bacterium]